MRSFTSATSERGTKGSGFWSQASRPASASVSPSVTLPCIISRVSGKPRVATRPVLGPERVIRVFSPMVQA